MSPDFTTSPSSPKVSLIEPRVAETLQVYEIAGDFLVLWCLCWSTTARRGGKLDADSLSFHWHGSYVTKNYLKSHLIGKIIVIVFGQTGFCVSSVLIYSMSVAEKLSKGFIQSYCYELMFHPDTNCNMLYPCNINNDWMDLPSNQAAKGKHSGTETLPGLMWWLRILNSLFQAALTWRYCSVVSLWLQRHIFSQGLQESGPVVWAAVNTWRCCLWVSCCEGWEWHAVFFQAVLVVLWLTNCKLPLLQRQWHNNLFVWTPAIEMSLTCWCWLAIWSMQQNMVADFSDDDIKASRVSVRG